MLLIGISLSMVHAGAKLRTATYALFMVLIRLHPGVSQLSSMKHRKTAVVSDSVLRKETTTYTWSEYSGVTDVRSGPDSYESDKLRIDSDPPDIQFENQCLFVRTMIITLDDDEWTDIHSTLGSVHVDPHHVRDRSSTSNRPQSSSPSVGGDSNLSPSPGVQYGTQRATGSGNIDLMSVDNPGMSISGLPERLVGLTP